MICRSQNYAIGIIKDREQHVLIYILHKQDSINFDISIIYAKFRSYIEFIFGMKLGTSIIGSLALGGVGDINVITLPEEKIGGMP